MRFSTSGSVRRIDLGTVAEVVRALTDEWAALRFDRDGRPINPVTDEAVDQVRLVGGTHRSPGARYEIVSVSNVVEADPEQLQALDAEMLTGMDVDWAEYDRRRAAISTVTGTQESRDTVVLHEDDSRRLVLELLDPNELWTATLAVVHGPLPRLELSGGQDVTRAIAAEGLPRPLARLFGGLASGSGFVDLALLDRRGSTTVAEASGAFNRFRGDARVDVKTSARSWRVSVKASVKARGIGRPMLLFLRSRLKKAFDRGAASVWAQADAQVADLERQLVAFRRLAETEGGIDRVMHRSLWEPGYADRISEEIA